MSETKKKEILDLLEELSGGLKETGAVPDKKEGYSLVISRSRGQLDIYAQCDGKRLKNYTPACPSVLRPFIFPDPAYNAYSSQRDLAWFLGHHCSEYPVILRTADEEKRIRFDRSGEYATMTEFDACHDYVTVTKACIYREKNIRSSDVAGNYVFDAVSGTFGMIRDRSGWQLWDEVFSFFYNIHSDEHLPDEDDPSFPMPLELFRSSPIIFPASEGDTPRDLVLKTEGMDCGAARTVPSYRITVVPSADDNSFTLRADCLAGGLRLPPVFKLFRFLLPEAIGLCPALRARKRLAVVYEAFFSALSAKNRTEAESVIKKALAHENFNRYQVRKKARDLLKSALSVFLLDERQLLLHEGQWLSVAIDKSKELSLYRIPHEIFGCGIFSNMPSHDIMSVPAEEFNKALPLLHEKLAGESIELFFENKQVKTASWDFAFDATRKKGFDWFEIRPEIRCNGELIDGQTWKKVVSGKGPLEKDGCLQILDTNAHKVLSLLSDLYKERKGGRNQQKEIVQVPRLRILDWLMLRSNGVKIRLSPEDEEILSRLTTFEKITPVPLPGKLKAKLRQYQKDGYAWLAFLYENRFGACLADDMGLGKTVQAISLLGGIREGMIKYPGKGGHLPHLVVMPPSLLFNWENEIKKFYPAFDIIFYAGKERNTSFKGGAVVLTTYGLVRRDIEKLRDLRFDVIVFDEAQAVKNISADTTGSVRQLKGNFKLAITGTPLENHVGEYYSIIDLAVPGLLGDYEEFRPLIKQDASTALDRIIARTRPFVLRRTKEEILKELPAKTETDIYLDLTEKQKTLYKKTVEQVRATIDNAYNNKTQAQARIMALTAIMKLRQLCVSPQLLSPELREASPKIDFLVENLKELQAEGHGALVFSQFTSFLDLLEPDLRKHGISFLRLDGSTQVGKRKKLVETFQGGEGPAVFLLSLKAGGQGLNLTRASYVFHLDPWWNPAVENQASDRAHRIGQKNKVTITRILMRHTIEEKMMALKKKKLELFRAVMEGAAYGKRGPSITRADFNFLLS
jgi:non-specific serine/threonine protein kinase